MLRGDVESYQQFTETNMDMSESVLPLESIPGKWLFWTVTKRISVLELLLVPDTSLLLPRLWKEKMITIFESELENMISSLTTITWKFTKTTKSQFARDIPITPVGYRTIP